MTSSETSHRAFRAQGSKPTPISGALLRRLEHRRVELRGVHDTSKSRRRSHQQNPVVKLWRNWQAYLGSISVGARQRVVSWDIDALPLTENPSDRPQAFYPPTPTVLSHNFIMSVTLITSCFKVWFVPIFWSYDVIFGQVSYSFLLPLCGRFLSDS